MTFTFGSSSSGATSQVVGSAVALAPVDGAIVYGKGYWALQGDSAAAASRRDKAAKGSKVEIDAKIPENITLKNYKEFTFYDMLGVTESTCDEATLKRSYHKAVLLYHPDKKHGNADFMSAAGEEDRTVFLKIQEAYNTLGDEAKRRAYDSQLPFDERYPSDRKIQKALEKGGDAYYALWKPVFARNARFSENKPAPDMGDENTPIHEVYAFYDWWAKFDSWRDFTGQDVEHNVDSATDREEKRWMIQENDRVARKKKRNEMERINTFVMLAMKEDPRIKAEKNKKKNAREAKEKEAKEAKERAEKEAAESAVAAAEAAKESKASKDKYKKATSKARNSLRKLLRSVKAATSAEGGEYGAVTDAKMDVIQAKAELGELSVMVEVLGGDAAAKDASLVKPDGTFTPHTPSMHFPHSPR